MASRSPQVILADLDSLLKETSWKGPPSDLSHLSEPSHLQEFKEVVLGGTYVSKMAEWTLKEVTKSPGLTNNQDCFRICSIGCGDGVLDKQILTELAKSCPSSSIHYVGVGLCEQGCEEVQKLLEGTAANVTASVVAKDYSELSEEELGTFDCVLMVSCICYFTAPKETLKTVMGLVKPSGKLVVISSSLKSVDELIARFWKHQRHYDLCSTQKVQEILQEIGVQYAMHQLPMTLNFSRYFNEDFKSVNSRLTLDHVIQVHMDDYAPTVCEVVIEYLKAIAVGPSDKRSVESISDMIVLNF